jgi:uncharacterized membrane protein
LPSVAGDTLDCTSTTKEPLQHRLHGAFGEDAFGKYAETAARFFGTPQYIAGQTLVVIVWIALNAIGLAFKWDPYPFILLNLAFSLQAAYAAPLILLAATRQAERDKVAVHVADRRHNEQQAHATAAVTELRKLLENNTALTQADKDLTEQIAGLTREIHAKLSG